MYNLYQEKQFIKICCISSVEEANLAIKYGASALGLVSSMPSGPGIIEDDVILQISNAIPNDIATFLLTSKSQASDIIEQIEKFNPDYIQIVDKIEKTVYQKLRFKFPSLKIVQVIHVQNEKSIQEVLDLKNQVDFILLDSGNPNAKIKTLGGTGKTHNWEISKKIVELSATPIILAGGLNSSNVSRAIEQVNPFGLDLCSGVRSNNVLNETKLADFFKAVDQGMSL